MAHTPGPWVAFPANYQGPPWEQPIFVVGPSEFHTVAQVRPGNTDDDLPAQTPANARLIAAAPDLLAACQGVVARCCGEYPDHPETLALLAAIAKATP